MLVTDYFTSDVHLTHDDRERSRRFARFVDSIDRRDRLTIVGDLCDFWFASRQRGLDAMACEGLRALASFRREGGGLRILLGNHDGALGPYYRDRLGAEVVDEPLRVRSHGLRLHLVHGHRVGARKPWKALMESRAFLHGFRAIPGPLASAFRVQLDRKNLRDLATTHDRHLDQFRRLVAGPAEEADLWLFGHVHQRYDERVAGRRLIVLGDWFANSPYVRIDEAGVAVLDQT